LPGTRTECLQPGIMSEGRQAWKPAARGDPLSAAGFGAKSHVL